MKILSLIFGIILSLNLTAQIEFIPNKGQLYDYDGNLHSEILYKVEQTNGNVYFKKDGLFFQFYRNEEKPFHELTAKEQEAYDKGDIASVGYKTYIYQMDLDLIGTNSDVEIISGDEMSMKRNFYLAHCPDGITNVKSVNEILYSNIYPHIDLKFYSVDGKMKYDFILHPGANVKDIKFAYKGFDSIKVDGDGIKIVNPVTNFSDAAPIAFNAKGEKIDVNLNYSSDNQELSYSLETDIVNQKTIIDPTMEWGTYFSGTTSATWTRPVFDSNENMYNAGYTSDASFPVLNAGAGQYFDGTKDGSNDLVIVKFNADHSQAWATYYGGDMSDYLAGYTDYGKAIAINNSDEIFVAGLVQSGTTVFPTYDAGGSSWYQDQTKIYGETSFILKFDSNGIRQWASIFQHENGLSTSSEAIRFNGITSDGTNVYFTGQLYNWNGSGIPLRTLAGAYNNPTYVGAQDPFIGRFDSNLDLEWCTYLNGGNPLNQAYSQGVDLHIDAIGNLWFVGRETLGTPGSHVLINPGSGAYYQSTHGGDQDLIITKFNSSLSIDWSTYYGGDGQDIPSMITTDNNNNPLIVCRSVKSTNWPTTDPGLGAYFSSSLSAPGNQDGGILKFTNNGTATWCTYIAGTGTSHSMTGIGADANNNIFVSGSTNSTDFPVLNEAGSYFDGTLSGTSDAVFMRFTPGGVMEWSTYYGGLGSESLYSGKGAVLEGACGSDMVAFGYTNSTDINLVDPGLGAYYQNTGGTNKSFIFYFSDESGSTSTDPTAITGPNTICVGETAMLTAVSTTLDPNDEYVWYSGSCGGTLLGTGNTISVSPTADTDYYVRAEGPCGETSCFMISLIVNTVDNGMTSTDGVTMNATAIGAMYQWVDCNDNYNQILGETSQSYTATSNGDYAVVVTENGCSDTSACYNVNTINLDENNLELGLNVYPNPSSGVFVIEYLAIDSYAEMAVIDALGRLVYTTTLRDQSTAINLSDLAKGGYHVRITNELGVSQRIPLILK